MANKISNTDSVFGSDFNKVILIDNNDTKATSKKSKSQISKLIVSKICNNLFKYHVKSIN